MSARSIETVVVPVVRLIAMSNAIAPAKAGLSVSGDPSWIGAVTETALSRATPALVLLSEDAVPWVNRTPSNSAFDSHDPTSPTPAANRLFSWPSSSAPTPFVAARLARAFRVSSPW